MNNYDQWKLQTPWYNDPVYIKCLDCNELVVYEELHCTECGSNMEEQD